MHPVLHSIYRLDAQDRVTDVNDAWRAFELVLTPREAGGIECATWVRGERTRSAVPLLDAHTPRTSDYVRMCGWCKRVRVDDD